MHRTKRSMILLKLVLASMILQSLHINFQNVPGAGLRGAYQHVRISMCVSAGCAYQQAVHISCKTSNLVEL